MSSRFLERVRRLRLPPALLAIGLVLLLGMGSAVAADRIGSRRIKDRSIRARDLSTGAATSRVVRDRAVKGADLGRGSVTRRSIANGSVGRVDLSKGVQTILDSQESEVETVRVTMLDAGGGDWSYSANSDCSTGNEADSTGSMDYANGTSVTPPQGTGSLEMRVGSNGDSYVRRGTAVLDGVRLTDIETLRYSTLVQANSSGQAPYMLLNVDNDNDGAPDDTLFFEPVYQTGTYAGEPVPDQGDVTRGIWQTWNAREGGWWSQKAGTFGPPLTTLDSYAEANGGETEVVSGSTTGLRIVAGCGGAAWADFVGNVDGVEIGAPDITAYDFERS